MDDNITYEKARATLRNAVYKAAMYLDKLEHSGLVVGSGHHAAQKIAEMAVKELDSRWVWIGEHNVTTKN